MRAVSDSTYRSNTILLHQLLLESVPSDAGCIGSWDVKALLELCPINLALGIVLNNLDQNRAHQDLIL